MANDLSELRRQEFPTCIRVGLRKLEDALRLPSSTQLHDLQQVYSDEFIFCFKDAKLQSIQPLGPIEELIVVRELSHFFGKMSDEAARNSLFITLFHPSTHDPRTPHKMRILANLVSLAIACCNVSVLEAMAVWMQQVCCLSNWCSEMCVGFTNDYFPPNSSVPPHFETALSVLPSSAPLFTANFITSLAQLYAKLGCTEKCDKPPEALLRTVVGWLCASPHLSLTPLTSTLPGVSLPMTAVPPIAPLMKLSVESPFWSTELEIKPMDRKEVLTKLAIADKMESQCSPGVDGTNLYSQLQLCILQTLQSVPSVKSRMTQKQVLCPKQVASIIDVLATRIAIEGASEIAVNLSLNRLAQIVLVALSTECLSGSLTEMWNALHRLPCQNRLIKTLLASRQSR